MPRIGVKAPYRQGVIPWLVAENEDRSSNFLEERDELTRTWLLGASRWVDQRRRGS